MGLNIIEVTKEEQLNYLYKKSALTFEGLTYSPSVFNEVYKWLDKNEAVTDDIMFYVIKGEFMNKIYNLTGSNKYPDDLTIVSIDGINQMNIVYERFNVGGRWFDDIVNNNIRRENLC